MTNDLELIKKLENRIGIGLERIEFNEVDEEYKIGVAINRKSEVIGLNLDGLKMKELPHVLLKFSQLKKLSLYDSIINDYSVLKKLSNLISLDLSYNRITNISILRDLQNISILNLTYNQIKDASILRNFTNLEILNLTQNDISDMSFIQQLNGLKRLDLSFNLINELPDAIFELGLEFKWSLDGEGGICLKGNPLRNLPLEIITKGKSAINDYCNSFAKSRRMPPNEVKVLLVGDGSSGKTSLVRRLLGKGFDRHETQTDGIDIKTWRIKSGENEIKSRIWDFGGQEIMRATHQFFLSKRSLYILVLDGRKDEKTEYWLKLIESFGGDSPVIVVINKIDENRAFEVNRKYLQNKYKNIKGFHRVSCKTGEGFEMFVPALETSLSSIEILKTPWAKSWFNVKTRLETMSDHFISYNQYLNICTNENVNEKSSQDTLVGFLNDLGVVLHFKNLELGDTHVLEPRWVTEAVYKILNYDELAECNGVLRLALLDKILKKKKEDDYEYPPDKYRYIIELMKKFEICYRLDAEKVLIPDLLEVEERDFEFDYSGSLKFIFEYDFLPKSVIPRFIVRMHKDIKEGMQWRTGVVLEDETFHSTAVVKAGKRERKIYIYVNGKQRRYYFAVIRHTFRDINDSFEKLEVKERVPVPDDPKITIAYKHLLQLRKMDQKICIPEDATKAYTIKTLLDGFEEDKNTTIALNINERWAVLDELDDLIFNREALEKEVHKVLEDNLWILGIDYPKIASNKTLKKILEIYLEKEYKGDCAKKRPDLLLTLDMNGRYLLIELKRPGHNLNRDDESQALKYRDDINLHLPDVKIDIILMGEGLKGNISSHNLRPDVKFLSYKSVISKARNNLKWLIDDLDSDHSKERKQVKTTVRGIY